MKRYFCAWLLSILAASAFGSVTVTSPSNGSTVSSPVKFVATATTNCSKGVASIGIYTAPYVLSYVVNGASLNTSLTLSPGTYDTTVEEWDNCGGATSTPVTITVANKSGVWVTSPVNKSTVSSPVNFVATATTTCSKGVASMGIYTAPFVKAYTYLDAANIYLKSISDDFYRRVCGARVEGVLESIRLRRAETGAEAWRQNSIGDSQEEAV